MILLIISCYFGILIAIGLVGRHFLESTGEDYFLANRSIGSFVLLMTLFGTQMTAFALLGASGESYRRGIGVFALMASSSALVVPILFHFLGTRIRTLGQRLGCLTQAQLVRQRWESDLVALLLFLVLVGLLVPYLIIGVMGAGLTFYEISGGTWPEWLGSLAACAVVLTYVVTGGLRGTSWANTFQTLVFMTLGVVTFFYVSHQLGGLETAMQKVSQSHPSLLTIGGGVTGPEMVSYLFIPLSAAMFPHLFMHWLSARSGKSFRLAVIAYPICICIVWMPTVLLGVLARGPFPDLPTGAVNSVLVRLIQNYSPDVLAGLLGAGVFAAIMSSLDSQVLAVGTMFTQDIVRHYGFHDQMGERGQVLAGRGFVAVILAAVFIFSLFINRSIFSLGVWCFSGYTGLLPILIAALFWRRSTKWGALASLGVTAVLWVAFFREGWGDPAYSVAGTGWLPVVFITTGSAIAMVVGSLLTSPPGPEVLSRFFADVENDQPPTSTERE